MAPSPSRATSAPKIPKPGRNTRGQFLKGAVANPKGRPVEHAEIKALALEQAPTAIAKLTALMHCDDPQIVIMASKVLLDRGLGTPGQEKIPEPGQHTTEYASFRDLDQVEAARAYQDLLASDRENRQVTFREPEHTEEWYAERDKQRAHEKELAEIAARPPGRPPAPTALARSPEPVAATPPERPRAQPRPRAVAVDVDPDDPTIVAVINPEAAADAELRSVHEHRAMPDSPCAQCRHLWVIS